MDNNNKVLSVFLEYIKDIQYKRSGKKWTGLMF